tara:strand:- start:29 stop:301 length:273 start_codon:yes stop_codon:yes gene_type:complete
MKVGDLVMQNETGRIGFVEKIDKDFYGATQAFKRDPNKDVRGECINSNIPDFIAPTKRGKLDRILVLWTDENEMQYFFSDEVREAKCSSS